MTKAENSGNKGIDTQREPYTLIYRESGSQTPTIACNEPLRKKFEHHDDMMAYIKRDEVVYAGSEWPEYAKKKGRKVAHSPD